MKTLLVLAIALGVSLGGYFTYYQCVTKPTREMLTRVGGEIEWLRDEYRLSDAQFNRIRKLHDEYAPQCDLLCEKIGKANARLAQLIKTNGTFTPELDAAVTECFAVQAECRRALLRHIYEVGAEMSPKEGARYVQMMTARIVEPGLPHTTVMSDSAK